MRIISGKHKSRRIIPPKNLPVRPTTDKCKEALFSILNHHFNFSNLDVLDLFAGTGNISYEFDSRGVASVIAVDEHFACIQFIKKTAQELSMNIAPVKTDVFQFLEKTKSTFDIIFADPPYQLEKEKFEKIYMLVFTNEILNDEGLLVIEHASTYNFEHLTHFSFYKKYGDTCFSFFEKESEIEDENYDANNHNEEEE